MGCMTSKKLFVKNSYLCVALITSISGCAQDYSFAPLPTGEKTTITIRVPKELEATPMRVMYRSAICRRITYNGNGKPRSLEGFKGFEMDFKRRDRDLLQSELFINGGGKCEWRLSNIVFSVRYRAQNRFGNATPGIDAGIIVVFDHNDPQIRSSGSVTSEPRDLVVVKDYYPWVNEGFIDGYVKTADLAGEEGVYLTYVARQARSVFFEPVLHSAYVVSSKEPAQQKLGEFITFYYPDGTIQSDGRHVPDFEKLQIIRRGVEGKK